MKPSKTKVNRRMNVETESSERTVMSEDSEETQNFEHQRAEKLVQYYKEKIQRQLSSYNKLRNEEIHFCVEYDELVQGAEQLDQLLTQLSHEAQEGIQKDHFLHSMFNEMMNKENPEVKMTGEYLKKSVPVTTELFKTLLVTSRTETLALENLTEIESRFQDSLTPLVKQRSFLNQKLTALRESYDCCQEKKRSLFDERTQALNELDSLKLELEFLKTEMVKHS